MEGILGLVIFTLLVTSLIALIRPLPKLRLHTRRKAGGLLVLSLLLTVMFGAIFGEEKDGVSPREISDPSPVVVPVAPAKIIANRLVIKTEREEGAVMLSLDTDLPDWSEVFVSLSRRYYHVGKEDAYSSTYFEEKARIAQWRTPRRIATDDASWKADLSADQAKMARISSDLAYKIGRIDDHLEARVVLHINQPDPRFGGRGNPHLSGTIVSKSGEWNIVEAEQRILAPLTGQVLPKQPSIVAYDGLQPGQSYRLLKQTPFSALNSEEVKDLPMDLTLRALGNIVQLPAGQIIHVVSVRKSKVGSREYAVEVEGVRGWILDTALMNTGVERAEPQHTAQTQQ